MAARQLMHISLGWHVVRMFVVHVPSDLKNYNILCPLARDISSGLRWTQNVSGVIYIKVTTISMFVFFLLHNRMRTRPLATRHRDDTLLTFCRGSVLPRSHYLLQTNAWLILVVSHYRKPERWRPDWWGMISTYFFDFLCLFYQHNFLGFLLLFLFSFLSGLLSLAFLDYLWFPFLIHSYFLDLLRLFKFMNFGCLTFMCAI